MKVNTAAMAVSVECSGSVGDRVNCWPMRDGQEISTTEGTI